MTDREYKRLIARRSKVEDRLYKAKVKYDALQKEYGKLLNDIWDEQERRGTRYKSPSGG